MRRALVIALCAAGVGCGPETVPGTRTLHPDAPPIAPFAECTVTLIDAPATSQAHAPACTALEYPTHPPSSGTHYSSWADFREYDAPVPWGFLVHALEHGAVVLAYRCDADCPEIVDALRGVAVGHEVDPLCRGGDFPGRFILVPDPDLEVPIAAVAWEHTYLATCLDVPSLTEFVDAHYAQAPENLCAPGVDLGASGWCP